MENKFEPLFTGEVLSVSESTQILIGHSTFRVDELAEALRAQLLDQQIGGLTADKADWFTEEGIPCEALRFGADGWQSGKVRIHIEFCPSGTASNTSSAIDGNSATSTASATPESEDVLDDFGTIEVADDLLADEPAESFDETLIEEPEDDLFGDDEGLDETLIEEPEDDLFDDEGLDETVIEEPTGDLLGEEESADDDLFGSDDNALDLGAETEEDLGDDLFGGADEDDSIAAASLGAETEEDLGDNLFGGADESDSTVEDSFSLDADGSSEPWGETEAAEGELALGTEIEEESMDDLFGGADDELDFGTEETETSEGDLFASADDEEELDLGDIAQDDDLNLGELEGSSEEQKDDLFDDVWQDMN